MAVPSDGSYGVPEGLMSSFPCTTSGGSWSIVGGLSIDAFSQGRLDATVAEMIEKMSGHGAGHLQQIERLKKEAASK